MFIPLSVVFKPTITPDTIALLVLIAALLGHAIGLIAAYVGGDRTRPPRRPALSTRFGTPPRPSAGRTRSSPP